MTNVWAGTVVNDVALNVFKQFDVGANDIANMYFKEKDGSIEASNLVNMVGSRININGTVNAIHNNKIGGNLYFLSSDGIAVGAGGVVNAGTLTLMTPSDRFMKTAMAAAGTDGVLTDATNAVINIFDDKYNVDVDTFKNSYLLNNWNKFQQMEVAINKTGTITVNGTINTIDGIRMKAAHINIGKEVDADGEVKNATAQAVLNSGIVNFDSLVKLTPEQKVAAGLDNDLTATVTGDGDIVLAAVANTVNVKDDYSGFMSENFKGNNSVQATVDIGNAKIEAKTGAIDISATATAGGDEGHFLGVDIVDTNLADILGGKISKADAQINIDGTLTAESINIAAVAENSYDEESTTNVGTLKDYVKDIGLGLVPAVGDAQDTLGLDVDVSYAKLASNAEVTIGEGATLTATGNAKLDAQPDNDNEDSGWRQGGALNISAISKLEANVGAEVESEGNVEEGNKGKAAAGQTGANKKKNNNTLAKVMPNAGIAIVDTDNKATVKVKGTLKAEHGDANVSASAVNSVEAASGVTAVADKETGAESNYINAAVTVANVNNSSKVELDVKEANIGGELNALAKSSSEVTTGASAGSDKNALLNSAINVTDASSTADLVIGGKITADNMNLAAENTISNEMQATNKLGETKREVRSKMGQGTLNKIFGNASKKVKKGDKVDKIGNYFSAGAAVNVVGETNKATVTVKRGAQLTATNSGLDNEGKPNKDIDGNIVPTINISANNTIEDSFMSATSVINNYTGGKGNTSSSGNVSTGTTSNTAAMASAAVLSADMNNSAQVIIEGSDDQGTSVPVIKGAHVNINANSAFEYDRLGSMIEGLKGDWNDIYEKYKEIPELGETLLNAMNASGNYLAHPSVDGAMDAAGAFSDVVEAISLKYVDTAMGVPDDLQTLLDDLTAFAEVSNYTNFYTAASTAGGNAVGKAGGSGSGSGQAKVAATGSINLNSIKNNAQVIVGKGAKIDASVTDNNNNVTKGELNISATAKQHDVALNGKTKYFIPTISNTSGASTAIGGSVGVHYADVNSLVVIGEGAILTGNDVNLSAENDLQHTAITFGGGKATNQGITGMFAYMEGQSNSIISVDDEASINAANKLALNANNDTTISNIIFDRTSAGNTAVGASIGIVDYKVNNIAAIVDNDSDAIRDENKEVKELVNLVHNQLSNDEKAQLGTSANKKGKGQIKANAVEVNATTTGTITGVSVAGVTAGATQQRGQSSTGGLKIPAQIAGAGSASVNEISGNTAALLEGVEVTTAGTDRDVKVSASDDSMIGAYSGAAALKKKGRQASSGGFSATLAGAVAYNEVKTGVTAQIKDASIENAKTITNQAAREGAVVAAGLALGVDTSGQGTGSATAINAGVSASVNKIDNSTHAVMNNVNTSASGGDKTGIANIAQSKDVQVAGGITAQYAKGGGIGIGAAFSSLHAANDIQSRITNSDLNNVGELRAYAQTDLVQVGTALSVGVIQGQNGNGVQAAVADNQLDNNVNVTIEGKAINAERIDAKAFDGEITATTTHLTDLAAEGFDVDGTDAMDDVNAAQADVSVDKNTLGAEKKDKDGKEQGDDGRSVSDFKADDKKGNLIVSGAVSVIANTSSQGKVAAGAAAVNQKISNNFTTNIKGATINANTVNAKAESDTLMVGATAGVAVSTGQQGVANIAGSVGVMQLDNNTTATIEDSKITANAIEAKAENKSRLINVAGQVSVSKGKVAAGLATTTNILHNTTGAYVYGSELNGKDAAKGAALTVEADNNSEAYAVAVGVAVQAGQQGAALSGDVAVNKGVNNTEAIVGKKATGNGNAIANIDKVTIKAVDSTKLKAISGGVTVSTGHAGLGGAVAYNEVGNGDADKQNTLAKLTDTEIKTAKATTIAVQAEDKSKMLAIAVGAAVQTGQTGAAAQGSAATTILHKNVEAAVSSVDVDKDDAKQNAALNVTAKNTSEAITSADVVAFTTANFAGGAAVAVTNSDNDTKASIRGGTLNLQSGKVQADSKVDIINVGIGVAAATGQGGALAGNVAVNNIKNDTLASISGAAINAKGTLGVLADSKEHIRNYAGALAVTAGQGYAAGGLSTAVNVISGDTKATVSDSAITAVGDDAGITVTEYAKDKKDNKEETLTGFVVNADSAHEIDNVVITGGVAVTSTAAVAATGTVAVNSIQGATVAGIEATDINKAVASNIADTANVNVRANDNTEIDSHVGSAAVAASANAGVAVGEASDSNMMNRNVAAQLVGKGTAKNTVNANKLTVNAFNKHDILSNAIGVAVAGSAYAGVGAAGTTSVLKTTAETTAKVENITGTNNGLTVNADHINKVQLFGNSDVLAGAMGGAAVGAAVAVFNDGSKTEAALSDSEIKHYRDNTADVAVTAKNDTDILSEAANAALSATIGAGVSGVITINNMDNAVYAAVGNSTIGEGNASNDITVKADNKLKTKFASGTGSAGLVAAGVAVGVNTIDTSVVTSVNNSKLYADKITLLADEERNIAQTAVSAGIGGIAANASVLITNIGTEVSDTYGVDNADGFNGKGEEANKQPVMSDRDKVDIRSAYKQTDKAIANQNNVVASDKQNTVDALGASGKKNVLGDASAAKDADGNAISLTMSSGLTADKLQSGAAAGRGGKADAKGVKVNVSASTIKAAAQAAIKADATTNANITVGNGVAAATAVGATVGVLNVERKSGVDIIGGGITAKNIDVQTNQAGEAAVKVYQGGLTAVGAVNVAYSGVELQGQNDINIKGAALEGSNGITIATSDSSKAKLETIGVSGTIGGSANIFVVDGKNASSSTITVDKDEKGKNSALTSSDGDITITSQHGEKDKDKPTMEATITPVAVAGLASGLGFNAQVEDNSKTNVAIGDGQSFTSTKNGGKVDINAINNSVNKVSSVTVNAALGAAIGATGVQVKGNAGSSLTVGNDNTFKANTVNLGAEANVINDAKITAVGAGSGSFMVNWATASGGTDVKAFVGDNKYEAGTINISGDSSIEQHADATGAIAGMYTSGTNLAKVNSTERVEVQAGGNTGSKVDTVNITANGVVKQNAESNGYGGALVDVSPAAAITKSKIDSATNAIAAGSWNAESMNVNVLHDNQVALNTDAVKAAIAGLSGVWSFSDVINKTGVTLDNAQITTAKDVAVKAKNDITYNNTVLGGGYGAAVGNAMDAKDSFTLNTNVELKNNSSITSKNGKIEMYAVTGNGTGNDGKPKANIDKKVTLKSAGLIAGSLAFSQDAVSINNAITVGAGSALATQGNSLSKDANDINLIAADMLGFTDVATADTQGGAVGAASTKLKADFERKNNITINGTVDSNYDAAFNAGGNSIMNVTLRSNAYNKTAAPIVANPALDYKMKQANVVSVGSNGEANTIQTARNINLVGDTGNTTIATEAKSWKWTDGGETGTGSLASTADGTQSSNDELNNGVQVDGKLLAGKNDKLEITITDGTDIGDFKTKLEEIVKNVLKEQKDAYDAAQSDYDTYIEGKDLENKRKAYESADGLYKSAEIIAAELNKNKSADGGVDKLNEAANTAKSTLDNSANAWWDANKTTDSTTGNEVVNITNADGTKTTISSVEDFLKQDSAIIKAQIKLTSKATEESAKEAEANAFVDKVNAYNNAQEAYSKANDSLTSSAKAAGVVLDATNVKYEVSDTLTKQYHDAEKAYKDIVEAQEYKDLVAEIKKTEDAYNTALSKQDDIVASVNDYIKKAEGKNFVNVTTSEWFAKENGGSAMNALEFKNYAQGLTDRLSELENLIQVYGGSAAEEAFKNEKTRIQNELVSLGLGYFEVENNQKTGSFVYDDSASTVPTVDLKNIFVTGGNINIKGGKLSGNGEMTAVGSPKVEITNNSKYYLRVNDITIGSDGGNVKFNDVAVKSGNGLTVADAPGKLVGGNNAEIIIKSTADKAKADEIFTPDVGIFGTVYNPFGKVTINNKHNNIYVAAEVKDKNGDITQQGGSLKAREIELSAGGSITQGYNDGIVNVGGNPHYSVTSDGDDPIKKIQQALVKVLDDKTALAKYRVAFKSKEKLAEFLRRYVDTSLTETKSLEIAAKLTDSGTKERAGMYASGAIYINAANVNINGTVQSGYDTYKVAVDNNLLSQRTNQDHTGVADFRTDAWLVTSGETGAVYDSTQGKYVYNVKAWYNPITKEIITEDIDQSGGGRIHIMGAVASTGGGQLVALDGGAAVTINNVTGTNLAVGSINADKVHGEITIIDTNFAKGNNTTVYTRDKVTQGTAKYNPKTGQMYIWTSGESSQVITTYQAEYDSKWFGLDKDRWENQLDQVDKVQTDYKELDAEQTTRGDVINDKSLDGNDISNKFGGTASGDTSNNIYQIAFERSAKRKQGTNDAGQLLYWTTDANGNNVLTTNAKTGNKTNDPYYLTNADGSYVYDTTKSDYVTTKKKKLWGLWGSHVTTTWKETKGMLTSYEFGLKADNPIDIKFIGNENGGSVGITSGGSVKLAGDIRANDVAITSNKGSILADSFGDVLNQKAIFSDNLKLQAGKNIEVVQQGVAKALNLNAQAGTTKDNYIKINALAGISTGDVYLENIASTGDIILDIQGKVLNGTRPEGLSGYALRSATGSNGAQAKAANITAGGKLFLKSEAGIGEENSAHIIKVGDYAELLAETGDIWAEQAGKEAMKLKQVQAKAGNVHLKADGGFVDALAENQTNTSNQEERLQEWKKQGILSDTPLATQKQNKYDEQVKDLTDQAKTNNILGDGYKNEAERNAATTELLKAGQQLTTDLAGDYNSYYAARKEMYTKQAALNDAISAKNNGDASKYEGALSAYNESFAKYAQAKKTYEDNKAAKIDAYVSGKGYTDAAGAQRTLKQKTNISQWLANYEELTHEATAAGENRLDKYGWNQNQLLYALQDSIINPSAGSVSDVNKANIIGNNIYLTTANGDLGKVADDQAFNIKLSELEGLFNEGAVDAALLKKMNKLAGARADDVTWGTSEIKVQRLTPISVKLNKTNNANDGKVSIEAPKSQNIYLIAKDSKLTMDKVISTGNVRLTGQEGIDIGTITGSNISLEGGRGDIKHGESNVLVGLVGDAGKINANAAGTILLKQLTEIGSTGLAAGTELNKNMVLGSLAAKNISIEATGNILSGSDKLEAATGSETRGISYINAGDKLTLKTSGSVGTAGDGLRIKNSGGVVEIDAQNGAYLEAKGDGTLVLGKIKTGTDASDGFVVNSEGSLSVGREAVQEVKDEKGNVVVAGVEYVKGSINADTNDAKACVKLTTANDLTFNGKVRANELTTQSYAGDIKQTTNESTNNIEVEQMKVSAITGDIILNNEHNIIKDISITGMGKTLDLVVSMENLNLNLGSKQNALSNNYGGDFKINNNAGNINVVSSNANIYGNIELKAAKDITVAAANEAAGNMGILATNKKVTDTDGSTNEAMLQQKGNITLTAGNSITNNGMLIAGAAAVEGAEANVTLNAGNNITTNGAITSAGNTSLNAKGTGAIEVKGTVNADGSISGTAENGPITIGAAMNSNNGGIALETNKNITINGTLYSANGDIKADSKQGNIETNAEITVDTGNVEQAAQGNIDNNANITVENGNINEKADGYIKSKDNGSTPITLKSVNGSINIEANGDINLYEVIANNGTADIRSTKGNIYLRNVNGKNVILVTKKEDAKLTADKVIAGKLTTNSDDTNLGISFNGQVRDDGYIEIGELTGNDGKSAIKNLNLNVELGDLGKGVIINKLWAENAKLKLADGTLAIDKLAVENRADFDVNSMTTTVFGVPPQRTGSDSIYWFNVDDFDFKNNNGWMKLIFSKTKHIQSSDGVLLQLRDYYYAYNQRFTAVDHLNQLLAENKADEYDISFTPSAALFLRYDLYDVHDSVRALADDDNAEQIIIES
ncbi:hypothetical protein [Phascolarctobacterium sp.]|uniref:hypothetical protein n=1 Tax=Phascolarctobacterium sp. TaxID=2049039 RepID=UPI0025DCE341|nr:hypothetical protein [Phascolarctobacterium sp.]